MKFFFAFLVVFFCLSPAFGQQKIDLVSQLGIQDDIKKLEQLVLKKVEGKLYRHPEELVQVHIFRLEPIDSSTLFSKEELLDYSFLKKLKCKYTKARYSRFGFKKKYLDCYTFLLTPDGFRLGLYITGHSCLYLTSAPISKEVWSSDNSTFLFFNLDEPNVRSHYILAKNDSLYYYEDYGEQLVPFEQYVQTHTKTVLQR
ncbi:MAG: hypothetical protein K6E73_08175 [Bacteroidales bacterium]|nr:hypothetical protein [Bacteroidales bacterium]